MRESDLYKLTRAQLEEMMVEDEAIIKGLWQPIETAPKDGTRILAYQKGKNGTNLYLVCYFNKEYGSWGNRDYGGSYLGFPTHWMPLPKPPEDKQ